MDGMEFLAHGILGRPVAQLIQTQVLHQAVRRSPTARQPVAVLELAVLALLSVQGLERGCSRSRVTPAAVGVVALREEHLDDREALLDRGKSRHRPLPLPGCPLHQSL